MTAIGVSAGRLFVVALLIGLSASSSDTDFNDHISSFHDNLIVVDTHIDIPWNFATSVIDPRLSQHQQVDLDKMQAGGMDVGFFIVYVDQSYRNAWEYNSAKQSALKKFRAIHRMVLDSPERVELVNSSADIRRIVADKKHGVVIGIENGFVIGQDIDLLSEYYDLGARYMTLVHNGHNDIGDSSQPVSRFGDRLEESGGLSEFGEEVVHEMNRLGMMVDVSHASKKTMMAAIEVSEAPVLASHSSVRAIVDHPRNLDDEQLLAIKANGGVVQVTAVDGFLRSQPVARGEAIGKIRDEMGFYFPELERFVDEDFYNEFHDRLEKEIYPKWPRATVNDLVDHIDYVVRLIGIDHVGISSDFDGGGGILGWDNAAETGNVTKELLHRGYSQDDIEKIWGDNLMRVMAQVEPLDSKGN